MKFPNLRPTPQTAGGHHPLQVAHLQSDCERSSRFKKNFLRLCVYKPLGIKLTDASPVSAARSVMQARSDTPTLCCFFLCACEVTTLQSLQCVYVCVDIISQRADSFLVLLQSGGCNTIPKVVSLFLRVAAGEETGSHALTLPPPPLPGARTAVLSCVRACGRVACCHERSVF